MLFALMLVWLLLGCLVAFILEGTLDDEFVPVEWPAYFRIPYAILVAPAVLFFVFFAYVDGGFKVGNADLEGTAAWYWDTMLALFTGAGEQV
jgi:hypothetical protein